MLHLWRRKIDSRASPPSLVYCASNVMNRIEQNRTPRRFLFLWKDVSVEVFIKCNIPSEWIRSLSYVLTFADVKLKFSPSKTVLAGTRVTVACHKSNYQKVALLEIVVGNRTFAWATNGVFEDINLYSRITHQPGSYFNRTGFSFYGGASKFVAYFSASPDHSGPISCIGREVRTEIPYLRTANCRSLRPACWRDEIT